MKKRRVRISDLTNKDVIKICLSHYKCEGCPLNRDDLPQCYLAQKYFSEFDEEIEIDIWEPAAESIVVPKSERKFY